MGLSSDHHGSGGRAGGGSRLCCRAAQYAVTYEGVNPCPRAVHLRKVLSLGR